MAFIMWVGDVGQGRVPPRLNVRGRQHRPHGRRLGPCACNSPAGETETGKYKSQRSMLSTDKKVTVSEVNELFIKAGLEVRY